MIFISYVHDMLMISIYLRHLQVFLLSHPQFSQQSGHLVETEEGVDGDPGVVGIDLGQELRQAEIGVAKVKFHLTHKASVGTLSSLPHLE